MTGPPLDAAAIDARATLIDALLRLPFLTTEEAAIVAGCSASAIRRHCQSGTLPAIRLGSRSWRIASDALRQWLSASTPAPAAAPVRDPRPMRRVS